MGNLFAAIYLLLFMLGGLVYAFVLFPRVESLARFLLGITIGTALLLWLPALFAFVLGFGLAAQLLALLVCVLPAGLLLLRKRPALGEFPSTWRFFPFALVVGLLLFLSTFLLSTHVLQPDSSGALHCGQSTFGDMAMHLSIISSIARLGFFPPEYSIQAGSMMSYPFLCDSISSTFVVLGATLRFAYGLPMIPALFLVFGWAYLLFERWLGGSKRAVLACAVFFLGGGLGLMYFIPESPQDPSNFIRIFTEFYQTPTNLTTQNIVWVNPIADMLIPQRATLFGWALLFGCIYLLYLAVFEEQREYFPLLGVLGGMLPLVHTHSFLALVILSAGLMVYAFIQDRSSLKHFLLYALIAALLALPQLLLFTFKGVADGAGFLTFKFNWVNNDDPYLWFYIKNWGLVFVLLLPALIFSKEKRWLLVCALPIWLIAEFIVFQPNAYDNNKLIFIPYFLACGLVSYFLAFLAEKIRFRWLRVSSAILVLCFMLAPGVLTLAREAYSDYVVFDRDQVALARYATLKLPDDSIILTTDNHNNAIASLSGLRIVQGSPSYLHFHGVYDRERADEVYQMYTQPGAFEALREKYGITHVLVGPYERNAGANEALFQNLDLMFSTEGTSLYAVP